jgi:hypothetical protein
MPVDLPQGNLVGHQQRRLQPGAAGLLDIVGRGLRRQARAQHTFAGQVHVARMLEHRAGHHLTQAQAVQAIALDQPFQRDGEHRLVAGRGVGAIGAGERDSVAAQDRDPASERMPSS